MLWRFRRELLLIAGICISLLMLRHGRIQQAPGRPLRQVDAPENLEELRRENSRLRHLLGLRERTDALSRMLVAEVVRGTPAVYPGEVVLSRGSADGVRKEAPVLSPEGWLVGRVVAVEDHAATVRTLYHPEMRVSVLVASSRELGVLQGGTFPVLWLKYVSRERPPVVNEEVLTSGLSEFYPKGIPVGRVCVVERGREEFFVQVGVRPYIGSVRIEEVLVGR